MVQRSHSLARRQAFLALLALALLVVMAACTQTGQATPTAAPSKAPAATTAPSGTTAPGGAATGVAAGNAEQGKAAIAKYNCGSCHTIPGISGANGTVGPSLANYPNIPQIAATLPNTPDNTVKWIMDPPAVKPGTAMPKLGVTQQDAQNIAAYLYTLK